MDVRFPKASLQTGWNDYGSAIDPQYRRLVDQASTRYGMSPLLKCRLEAMSSRLMREKASQLAEGSVGPAEVIQAAIEKLVTSR